MRPKLVLFSIEFINEQLSLTLEMKQPHSAYGHRRLGHVCASTCTCVYVI